MHFVPVHEVRKDQKYFAGSIFIRRMDLLFRASTMIEQTPGSFEMERSRAIMPISDEMP